MYKEWNWSNDFQFFYKGKSAIFQNVLKEHLNAPEDITSWKKVTPITQSVGTSSSGKPFWVGIDENGWETNTVVYEKTLDALASRTPVRSSNPSR